MTNESRLTAALSGRYRIERELGQGGMATVYLAHDIRHDRKVAVKVLRPELAAVIGAERFLAEIRTTANLQHPHILPLFDSGAVTDEAQSPTDNTTAVVPLPATFLFYVMPYVEGVSLRDRMSREKQLPIKEAVRIATEIAGALDYAHRHGVVHRDIKPENILLQDGSALVADFGIALAASKAGGRMTETGMSLGTPQYMSPEQAMGERELDARSDVYALGCVTYEMLTGEPPFSGPTAQAIVAKVMTADPVDVTSLRKTIPAPVGDAVHIALQKLPADRFSTAAEFATALESNQRHARSTGASTSPRTLHAPLLGAALMVCALVIAATRFVGNPVAPPVTLGRATHLTWESGLEVLPALSPDGRAVAYAAGPTSNFRILIRDVAGGRAVPLSNDTSAGESSPVWFPDGSRVFYLSRGGVFSAPAGGGPARPEVPRSGSAEVSSVTFASDGKRMAFSRGDSLFIRESDGSAHGVARMTGPTLCSWSPSNTLIACATGDPLYVEPGASFNNLSPGRITLFRVSNGALTTVTDSLSLHTSPAWSPDGNWIYFISNQDGPRDIYALRISGSGHAVGNIMRITVGLGAQTISVGRNGGQLAYSSYNARTILWWMPVPKSPGGTTTDAMRITNASEYIEQFNPSADGKWLYYDSDLTGNDDIFRIPVAGGDAERLTTDPADDFAPAPSPDGTAFAFHSWRTGSRDIFVQRLDGGGIEQLTHTAMQEALPDWSPDGSALAFSELNGLGGVWVVRRNADGHWGAPVRRANHGSNPTWSPDGKSLVWISRVEGGSVEEASVDSGPVRVLYDATLPGHHTAEVANWYDANHVAFTSHGAHGESSILNQPLAGGEPTLLVHFDPVRHSTPRGSFVVKYGRIYFASEDAQSDIWLVEMHR